MPKSVGSYNGGRIDILSLAGVGFITLSLVAVVSVTTNPDIKQVFSSKATVWTAFGGQRFTDREAYESAARKASTEGTDVQDQEVVRVLDNAANQQLSTAQSTVTTGGFSYAQVVNTIAAPNKAGYALGGGVVSGYYLNSNDGKYYPIGGTGNNPDDYKDFSLAAVTANGGTVPASQPTQTQPTTNGRTWDKVMIPGVSENTAGYDCLANPGKCAPGVKVSGYYELNGLYYPIGGTGNNPDTDTYKYNSQAGVNERAAAETARIEAEKAAADAAGYKALVDSIPKSQTPTVTTTVRRERRDTGEVFITQTTTETKDAEGKIISTKTVSTMPTTSIRVSRVDGGYNQTTATYNRDIETGLPVGTPTVTTKFFKTAPTASIEVSPQGDVVTLLPNGGKVTYSSQCKSEYSEDGICKPVPVVQIPANISQIPENFKVNPIVGGTKISQDVLDSMQSNMNLLNAITFNTLEGAAQTTRNSPNSPEALVAMAKLTGVTTAELAAAVGGGYAVAAIPGIITSIANYGVGAALTYYAGAAGSAILSSLPAAVVPHIANALIVGTTLPFAVNQTIQCGFNGENFDSPECKAANEQSFFAAVGIQQILDSDILNSLIPSKSVGNKLISKAVDSTPLESIAAKEIPSLSASESLVASVPEITQTATRFATKGELNAIEQINKTIIPEVSTNADTAVSAAANSMNKAKALFAPKTAQNAKTSVVDELAAQINPQTRFITPEENIRLNQPPITPVVQAPSAITEVVPAAPVAEVVVPTVPIIQTAAETKPSFVKNVTNYLDEKIVQPVGNKIFGKPILENLDVPKPATPLQQAQNLLKKYIKDERGWLPGVRTTPVSDLPTTPVIQTTENSASQVVIPYDIPPATAPKVAPVAPVIKVAKAPTVPIKPVAQTTENLVTKANNISGQPTTTISATNLPSGNKATFLRMGPNFDKDGNYLIGDLDISTEMLRPGGQPLARRDMALPENQKYIGIHIPDEIDSAAWLLQKETLSADDYLDYVGNKLGWFKDANDRWVVPKDQIEKLTPEQFRALLFKEVPSQVVAPAVPPATVPKVAPAPPVTEVAAPAAPIADDSYIAQDPLVVLEEKIQEIIQPKKISTVRPLSDTEKVVISKAGGMGTASESLAVNEDYGLRSGGYWLYAPNGVSENAPISVVLSNGDNVSAVYKVHVTATPENFNDVLQKTTAYLRELNITHKVAPGLEVVTPQIGKQYGKAITIYAEEPKTLNLIVKKMQELANEGYKGIPIKILEKSDANLAYELPVPGTNDLLYYTVEQINGKVLSYSERARYMEEDLFGQGPLDYLWQNVETPIENAAGVITKPQKFSTSVVVERNNNYVQKATDWWNKNITQPIGDRIFGKPILENLDAPKPATPLQKAQNWVEANIKDGQGWLPGLRKEPLTANIVPEKITTNTPAKISTNTTLNILEPKIDLDPVQLAGNDLYGETMTKSASALDIAQLSPEQFGQYNLKLMANSGNKNAEKILINGEEIRMNGTTVFVPSEKTSVVMSLQLPRNQIDEAFRNNSPVNAKLLEANNAISMALSPPEGYILHGDFYIYRPNGLLDTDVPKLVPPIAYTPGWAEIDSRLNETLFNDPINKGELVFLASDSNAKMVQTASGGTELTLPSNWKFTVSPEGRLSSVVRPNSKYKGIDAEYLTEYSYSKNGNTVYETNSYVTSDGQIVKDRLSIYSPNQETIKFNFDKKTGELTVPDDTQKIKITDQFGKEISFTSEKIEPISNPAAPATAPKVDTPAISENPTTNKSDMLFAPKEIPATFPSPLTKAKEYVQNTWKKVTQSVGDRLFGKPILENLDVPKPATPLQKAQNWVEANIKDGQGWIPWLRTTPVSDLPTTPVIKTAENSVSNIVAPAVPPAAAPKVAPVAPVAEVVVPTVPITQTAAETKPSFVKNVTNYLDEKIVQPVGNRIFGKPILENLDVPKPAAPTVFGFEWKGFTNTEGKLQIPFGRSTTIVPEIPISITPVDLPAVMAPEMQVPEVVPVAQPVAQTVVATKPTFFQNLTNNSLLNKLVGGTSVVALTGKIVVDNWDNISQTATNLWQNLPFNKNTSPATSNSEKTETIPQPVVNQPAENNIIPPTQSVRQPTQAVTEQPEQQKAQSTPKITVLGDSITQGYLSSSLFEQLNAKGYDVEFLGNQKSYGGIPTEGHGGYTTEAIKNSLEAGKWYYQLDKETTPQVQFDKDTNLVILELGVNDMGSGFSPDIITIPNMRYIINYLRDLNPNIKVIITPVPNIYLKNKDYSTEAKYLNIKLTEMASQISTSDSPVVMGESYANQYILSQNTQKDGVHPNKAGADKIAESIVNSIENNQLIKKQEITTHPTIDQKEIPIQAAIRNTITQEKPCKAGNNNSCSFSDNIKQLPTSTYTNKQIVPKMIIIHWDENKRSDPTQWITQTTYNGLQGNNTSAQFAVGSDGVLQMLPTYSKTVTESHGATGYYDAINIEFAGYDFNNNPPTKKELESGIELITNLSRQYNISPNEIFGHYEKDTFMYKGGDFLPCTTEAGCMTAGKSDPSPEFVQFVTSEVEKRLLQVQ